MCACYKCPRRNHAATWRDRPARVPGEDGRRTARRTVEDDVRLHLQKRHRTCKCVRPFVFKDVRIKCVKHMETSLDFKKL